MNGLTPGKQQAGVSIEHHLHYHITNGIFTIHTFNGYSVNYWLQLTYIIPKRVDIRCIIGSKRYKKVVYRYNKDMLLSYQ